MVNGWRNCATGLPAAQARWATAISPNCCEVVPYACMCRRAQSAYRMLGLTAPEATDQPANPFAALPVPDRLGERHEAPAERSGFNGVSAKTHATVVAAPAVMACTAWATITPAVAPNALTCASRFSSPRPNTAAKPTPPAC